MADIKPQKHGKNRAFEERKFKKGECGNPNGRPKGRKNFETLFYEALEALAKANNTKPEKIHQEIFMKGITSARKGDYRFYKDLLDRLHGQATQKSEVSGPDGQPLLGNELIDKSDIIERFEDEYKKQIQDNIKNNGAGKS